MIMINDFRDGMQTVISDYMNTGKIISCSVYVI